MDPVAIIEMLQLATAATLENILKIFEKNGDTPLVKALVGPFTGAVAVRNVLEILSPILTAHQKKQQNEQLVSTFTDSLRIIYLF